MKWTQMITSKSKVLIPRAFTSNCGTFRIVPWRKGWCLLFDNRYRFTEKWKRRCGTLRECKLEAEKILEDERKSDAIVT